ncbi:MAG: endonuclease/exonuclease/phosphatase family protein [Chitinophagaceae bacterium]|nr:MAG: endonuclease/exonuclease/phosphatase family protein [Chitinophagaceae bacterium]
MKKLIIVLLCCSYILVADAQSTVNVMSFNIRLDVASDGINRWDARKDRVAGLINFYAPDFAGTQEVQHHQRQYLLDSLNGYAAIGVARDDGKTEGEYSCIFYKKDKFKVLQQSTFWLSPTPDSISFGWKAACRRVCTYGLFQSLKTKELIWVFNTHFDHVSAEARVESAKLIVQKITALNTKNYPVVVTGDFNSKPLEEPAQFMMANMNNARSTSQQVYGNAATWNGFQFNKMPEGCIDYIFVSKNNRIGVTKFATLTDSYDMKYPSDHFPILATLNIVK